MDNEKMNHGQNAKESMDNEKMNHGQNAKESMDNEKMNHGQNKVKVKVYKRRLNKVHSEWFTEKDDRGNLYEDWLSLKDEYTVR